MSVYKRTKDGNIIPRNKESKTLGTWYFDFTIRGVRYKEAMPEVRTRKQAERGEVSAREDVYNNRYNIRQSPLFKDFVKTKYRPWAMENKRSYDQADAVYLTPLESFFGKYKLAEIQPLTVEKYKKERRATKTKHDKDRKPSSVNRETECLSRILSMAVDNGDLQSNPCSKVRKLRENNKRNRYLTLEEELKLMRAMEESPSYLLPLVILAIETGMRRGELLNLEWRDVDFNRKTIYVRDPKNANDREIPMSDKGRAAILIMREDNKLKQSLIVFDITDPKKAFSTAIRRANITNFRFHDLRHTAATRWAAAGADAFTIAALLGHLSIQTSTRYTHAISSNLRKVVNFASTATNIINFIPEKKTGTVG